MAYQHTPPSAIPYRRGAVDFTGNGDVQSDHWHRGLASEVVSRNHSQFPGVHFFPSNGVGAGVALTECEYSRGIAVPTQSVYNRLPPHFQNIESGSLVITWPGYQHLKFKHKVIFRHSSGEPLTMADLACQIAYIWRKFYQRHGDCFDGRGIRLGATGITYNHLRLHQIFSNDGRTWQAEISYITSL